jgi:hypothetical protein
MSSGGRTSISIPVPPSSTGMRGVFYLLSLGKDNSPFAARQQKTERYES